MLRRSSIYLSLISALLIQTEAGAQFLTKHLDLGVRPGVSAFDSTDLIALDRMRKALEEERSFGQALYGPDCPEQVGKPNTVDQPTKLAKEVAKIVAPALALTGRCPSRHTDLAEDLARLMKSQVGDPPKIRIRKQNSEFATADDWIAVDLLARTLYGEVGGRPKCSDSKHLKAVGRVIMNRQEFMADAKRAKYTSFYKDKSQVKNQIALAAINAEEFHVWDPDKKDTVGRWMACPGTEKRPVLDPTGKQVGYIGDQDVSRWQRAVSVASEMIFKQNKFRCETKDVRGVFYSKGDFPPGKNFRKTGASVRIDPSNTDDGKLDGTNCVELWENPSNPFQAEMPEDCEAASV